MLQGIEMKYTVFKELEANLKLARHTRNALKQRIKELEGGSCRYNCRKRKESCQSFAYYVWKNWKSKMMPPAQAFDDMYAQWRKDEQA